MEVRFYRSEDSTMIAQWCKDWDYPYLPPELLPPTGIIVSNQGCDIAACWLYKSDGAVAWLEGLVSNRFAPRKVRSGGIEFCIDVLSRLAADAGYKVTCTFVQSPSLIKRAKAIGFSGLTNVAYLARSTSNGG